MTSLGVKNKKTVWTLDLNSPCPAPSIGDALGKKHAGLLNRIAFVMPDLIRHPEHAGIDGFRLPPE
jgi:hypothetical protein